MGDRRVQQRDSAAQDAADLQTYYKRKKSELIAQKEKELESTKEYYTGRVENAEKQGEAAVNHIKKLNRAEKNALEDQLAQTRERGESNLKAVVQQEQIKRNRISADTQKAAQELNENRQNAERKAQAELAQFSEKTSTQRTRLIEKSKTELQTMQDKYDQEMKARINTRQSALDQEKSRSMTDLARIRNEFDARINREKESGEASVRRVQTKAQVELERQQLNHENSLNKAREDNQTRILREQERGESQRQKIASTYQRQFEQTSNLGERRIQEVETKNNRVESRMQQEHQQEIEKEKKLLEARKTDMVSGYDKERARNQEAYQKNLARQREHFKSAYQLNQNSNQTSLNNQKEVYFRELEELKRNLATKVDKYASRDDDPFYKVKDLGTRFVETPTSYILRTRVPEHEVQNVKVRIQNDSATITGQRHFQDRVEDGEATRSTSSSESFRESFKLEHPVAIKAVRQERDGDHLTVTIPKIGFGIKG